MHREKVFLSCMLAFAACQGAVSPDRLDDGSFTASVRGAVEVDYVGTGAFYVGRDPRSPSTSVLTVRSEGVRDSEGEELVLYGAVNVGEVGRYALEAASDMLDAAKFTAFYVRKVAQTYQMYGSVSGEVEITRSAPERVEGSVRITALWYCTTPVHGDGASQGSCDPRMLNPDAPSIAITGSFVAGPDTEEVTR
jgi:hypothetical protein